MTEKGTESKPDNSKAARKEGKTKVMTKKRRRKEEEREIEQRPTEVTMTFAAEGVTLRRLE